MGKIPQQALQEMIGSSREGSVPAVLITVIRKVFVLGAMGVFHAAGEACLADMIFTLGDLQLKFTKASGSIFLLDNVVVEEERMNH